MVGCQQIPVFPEKKQFGFLFPSLKIGFPWIWSHSHHLIFPRTFTAFLELHQAIPHFWKHLQDFQLENLGIQGVFLQLEALRENPREGKSCSRLLKQLLLDLRRKKKKNHILFQEKNPHFISGKKFPTFHLKSTGTIPSPQLWDSPSAPSAGKSRINVATIIN